jgi:hypothetical protein
MGEIVRLELGPGKRLREFREKVIEYLIAHEVAVPPSVQPRADLPGKKSSGPSPGGV